MAGPTYSLPLWFTHPSGWSMMIARNILHGFIGLCIGGAVIAFLSYASNKWNNAVVYSDVKAVVVLDTHNHEKWLAVRYHLDHENSCPSWSQHLIYRDNEVGDHTQRNYVPLAITANGIGSGSDAHDFALSFRLPNDLQPGEWYYVVVMSSSCEWLPGLTRQTVQETVPRSVIIK